MQILVTILVNLVMEVIITIVCHVEKNDMMLEIIFVAVELFISMIL